MESFLMLLQNGSINLNTIINKEVMIDDCVSVYQELKEKPE